MSLNEKKLVLSPVKCSAIFKDLELKQLPESSLKGEENSQNGEAAGIHSVAIVKKSQVEFPVTFRQLQSNTDIKTPPSNWLRGQFSICLPDITPKRSDFTSFIMGYQFPDCIGEVDIVSDAENIKKLLKMAYKPNTHLSMMVHRVGKTILIDEFDIYKYLLRNAHNEWEWLKKFFYDHVLASVERKEENVIVRPDKSRDVVQSKNLLSKFLYHSIEDVAERSPSPQPSTDEIPATVTALSSPTKDTSCELLLEDHLPESSVQPFARNIIWNFENVRMLLGTDLPIFGGRTHPCVSLRLKDMDKPINILTGIDYWLDNLMCNVPEVVMCYHQNGIVQKYELIKTEDLPHISDSPFSPELVRDIAHNILSFLKSKATKEGHTYWLFKGKDDFIVKLYDLTSLCNEQNLKGDETEKEDGAADDNPFTVPVAMLLYCVAKNMWNLKDDVSKLPTICSLLDHSLSLLNKEKYPKIICHCHLILADIYLPQSIDPDAPNLFDVKEEELDLTKVEGKREEFTSRSKKCPKKIKNTKSASDTNSIDLDTLRRHHEFKGSKSKQKNSDKPQLSNNLNERCTSALKHVIMALQFLSLCPTETASRSTSSGATSTDNVPEEPKRANQYEPIPMPYEPLNKPPVSKTELDGRSSPSSSTGLKGHDVEKKKSSKKKTKEEASVKTENVIVPKAVLSGAALNSHLKDASWIDQMSFKFLRKASLVYMTKGRLELNHLKYGLCLRNAKLSLRSWCAMMRICYSDMDFPLPAQPLLLAGDVYYNLAKSWDQAPQHVEDFNFISDEHSAINEVLEKFSSSEDIRWTIKAPCDYEDALKLSFNCFEIASKFTNCQPDLELKRRLASICNELGCMYMNQADEHCRTFKFEETLWDESWIFLEKASDIFKEVEDIVNVALLHCNKGRYLRLYAFYSSSSNGEQIVNPTVSKIYEKAMKEYEAALDVLKSKTNANEIAVREKVVWEYSSTLLGYATLITGDDTRTESENDCNNLISMYDKCLKLCKSEVKVESSNEPLFEYRIAVIYIRLASIYHQKYRFSRDPNMMTLAEKHYTNSEERFIRLDDASPSDILKAHLDHVVLLEDHIEGTKSSNIKWKSYLSILKLLTDCSRGLTIINKQKEEKEIGEIGKGKKKKGKKYKKKEENEEENEDNIKETEHLNSLLELLLKKLHTTLMTMLKMSKSDSNKSLNQYEEDLKGMYSASLNMTGKSASIHLAEAFVVITPKVLELRSRFR